MNASRVAGLDTTFQKTHLWLKELAAEGHFESQSQAYTALRAVLHSLRDRLPVEEAAQLASELPMLVRGIYYEGWKPALAPNRERTLQQFLNSISESLHGNTSIDPQHAARAVFGFLQHKISRGELNDVVHMLPHEIADLWCQPVGPESR
jgi:uncharacterized protein (DUF2267 family)